MNERQMVKCWLVWAVVCLGALLLGCSTNGDGVGGNAGSGGMGGTGGPPVIAPTVTETVPQDMAIDVATNTTVRASFDTALDSATVTTTSFVVRRGDGAPLAGSVAVDMTGLTAIFTLDTPLNLSSPHTAMLTTDIKSISGGALEANFSWGFATREGAWVGAEPIDTGDTDAISPDVALDASGNAVTVWSQMEGPRFRIWANRFVQATGWGDGEIIGDVGAAGTSRVAVDPQGNAVAVWDESDQMSSNIWANRFTPMNDWGGGQLIEDNSGTAEAAQVGADADGNAITAWRQEEGTRFDIWANRFIPETGWNEATRIEINNAGDANTPRLAVAPKGNAIAVWSQFDGTRTNIWANLFLLNVGWGNAMLVEKNAGAAVLPDVGLDSSVKAIAAWSQTNGTRYSIWANRFTRLDGWADAQLIETDEAGDASDVHVVVDPDGNAHAVWQQSDGTVTSIWANSFTPGSGWGEAQLIENDDVGSADSPRVAGDPNGNVIAVWSQSDGIRRNIWANHFSTIAGWGTPQLLEVADAGDAVSPQVALDPGGRGIAVWSYFDGTRSSIWANRFE